MPARISLPGNRFLLLGVGALLLGLGARAEAGAVPDFDCFLRPLQICDIDLGDIVEVHFEVDSTAVQFNGYELTLQYDHDVLEFMGFTEGALMTNACGTRFQNLTTTDSTLTFSHVTLCSGVSVDGPGRLSTFKFKGTGAGEAEVTIVSDPDRLFVDAGLWVWPGHSTFPRQVVYLDGGVTTICVIDPTADIEPGSAAADPFAIGLRLFPNPASDIVRVELSAPVDATADVEILSADGRRVAPPKTLSVGSREFSLPLRDFVGEELPAGTYFVRARSANGTGTTQKLTIVR